MQILFKWFNGLIWHSTLLFKWSRLRCSAFGEQTKIIDSIKMKFNQKYGKKFEGYKVKTEKRKCCTQKQGSLALLDTKRDHKIYPISSLWCKQNLCVWLKSHTHQEVLSEYKEEIPSWEKTLTLLQYLFAVLK